MLKTTVLKITVKKDNFITICRIYTFGFGRDGSRELIQGLAVAGRGAATFINEDERVQQQVEYI